MTSPRRVVLTAVLAAGWALAATVPASAAPYRFVSPEPRAPLTERVELVVSAQGAGTIVFRARWAEKGRRRTRTIGTDRAPGADGTWRFVWDASAHVARTDVEVVARVLDHDGDYLGTTAWMPLTRGGRVAGVRSSSSQTLEVDGTCGSAGCRLNVREEPDARATRIGQLREGEDVAVRCRTKGATVRAGERGTSRVWVRLADDGWVSSLYLVGPPDAAPLPWC